MESSAKLITEVGPLVVAFAVLIAGGGLLFKWLMGLVASMRTENREIRDAKDKEIDALRREHRDDLTKLYERSNAVIEKVTEAINRVADRQEEANERIEKLTDRMSGREPRAMRHEPDSGEHAAVRGNKS